MYRNLMFMAVLWILLVPRASNAASLIRTYLKLAQGDYLKSKHELLQISPSPSPVSHSVNTMRGSDNLGGVSGGYGSADSVTDERCDQSSSKLCQVQNMTGCLLYAGSGKGSFIIIQNEGENFLKTNLTILPMNITFEDVELLNHKAKKINISAYFGAIQSISLHDENGDCVIHMESPSPNDNAGNQITPRTIYDLNSRHGAYLLISAFLLVGIVWSCFKLKRKERHLDGVPYKELEMEKPESLSGVKVETTLGWDQGWDDEWDEESAVKSLGGKQLRIGQANGTASRPSNSDEWGNDWDD